MQYDFITLAISLIFNEICDLNERKTEVLLRNVFIVSAERFKRLY